MVGPMHEYTINGCRSTDSHTSALTPFRMLINDRAPSDRFPPMFYWPVLHHICCYGNDPKCQDVPHDWKGAIIHIHSTMFTYRLRMDSVTKRKECQLYFKFAGVLVWPDFFFSCFRIIPFQRPLKFKDLLQKVTEAFGQQMDLYYTDKEVVYWS